MTVRVAVVGLAGMGLYHLITAHRLEEYELVAACDVDPASLEHAREGVKRFEDTGELFASGVADAAIIATPNALHARQVSAALEAGLHVYCEKPLAMTIGECREIAELSRSTGRRVQVGFQHRFQHSYATLHRLVSSGELGPLNRADMCATHWFRPHSYFKQREWRGRWSQAGGGVLMLQAIHQLDAFLWACGTPSRVTAIAKRTRPESEVEDEVTALLEFPGGAHGVVTASTINPTGCSRIELHLERGSLVVEGDDLRQVLLPNEAAWILANETNPFVQVEVAMSDLPPEEGSSVTFDDCVIACHRDFLRAIKEDREPVNDPDEATRAVEVTNAVYMSAALGEPVDLPLDAAAYDEVFAKLSSGDLSFPLLARSPA